MVASVSPGHMDSLEPRLVRDGRNAHAAAKMISAKQGEVRLLLQGRLEASRACEMTEQVLAARLPV